MGPAAAAASGTALRGLLVGLLMVRGVAGLLLVAYGAWLAWPPAGPIVVGAGLLADRVAEARRPEDGT